MDFSLEFYLNKLLDKIVKLTIHQLLGVLYRK